MKLLKEYIERLPTDSKFDTFEFIKKNIIYLNEDCKDILLEDLVRIDFCNLYPNIILGLYNEGLINTKWESDIKKLKLFLENVDKILPNAGQDFTFQLKLVIFLLVVFLSKFKL